MSTTIFLISLAALLLGLLYFRLIRFLLSHWEKLAEWQIPSGFQPETRVSVLIPARNESANILRCLNSLLRQDFPQELLQILVIDDHSTDDTAALVRQFNRPSLSLLQLSGPEGGKKAALTHAIRHATGDLIMTTDADCDLPERWISSFVAYYQAFDPVFITGPVVFDHQPNALERFQSLDMMGTMLITGAGIRSETIYMSNGANLAYSKRVFEAVGGFAGVDHLASGDDMLLMHKVQRAYPGRIAFLKCATAVVSTPAVTSWRGLIRQRLRWATKSGTYRDKRIIVVLALVFLLSWGIILSPLLAVFAGWWGLLPFGLLLGYKSAADHQLLSRATAYFHREKLMQHFALSQLIHTVYIAVIGLLANVVRRYEWKGRRVN